MGPTILVQRSPRQLGISELVTGLAGVIREADFDPETLSDDDRYYNLRSHKLQTDYFWGGPEFERDYPGFLINDIQKVMAEDFGITTADFDVPESFPHQTKSDWQEYTFFVPGTTYDAKTWSTTNWLKLRDLLHGHGHKICVIGQPAHSQTVRELKAAGMSLFESSSLQEAIDVISSARMVVSVDTGLMHLAVQQGIVTLGLLQDPIFFRPYPNSHRILSKSCSPDCIAQRMASRPQDRVRYPVWEWDILGFGKCLLPEMERCINSISAEQVLQSVLELVPQNPELVGKS
jgi:ADP-heptose:LPS heptosyltransferase